MGKLWPRSALATGHTFFCYPPRQCSRSREADANALYPIGNGFSQPYIKNKKECDEQKLCNVYTFSRSHIGARFQQSRLKLGLQALRDWMKLFSISRPRMFPVYILAIRPLFNRPQWFCIWIACRKWISLISPHNAHHNFILNRN